MAEEKIDVEKALTRLEEIVKALESDEIKLDESLRLFEEGVKLASAIKKRLEESELKVRKVLEGAEGFKVEDFLP
jgi:exodeoxyribonuclease VII small subunit